MPARQPLPRLWLMTDERMGESLWQALERLPAGGGIVFRHRSLPDAERRALFERVRRLAHARGLLLMLAGTEARARAWGADGFHGAGRRRPRRLLKSAPVHGPAELRAAERAGADFLFVSPVFPTRSHPGAAALGPAGFARLARRTRLPAIALGGMDAAKAAALRPAYGWAAIDAWLEESGGRPGG